MGKQSKNLGTSKSCPVCGLTIFRDLTIDGWVIGKIKIRIKCPHCKLSGIDTPIEIEIMNKTKVTIIRSILALIIIWLSFSIFINVSSNNQFVKTIYQDGTN